MRSVRGASSQPNVWLLAPLINIWQVALFKGVEPLSQDILFFLVMPYPTHPSAVIKMKWKSGTICLLATLDGQRAVTMFSSFCLFFKRLLTCLTVFYHQKWKKKNKKNKRTNTCENIVISFDVIWVIIYLFYGWINNSTPWKLWKDGLQIHKTISSSYNSCFWEIQVTGSLKSASGG
jgi:hypothetical protein